MRPTVKALLTLFLTCLMLAALAIPAAADVIVSPRDYVLYTPVGWVLAAVLIIAVVLITVLLVRRFFGKKK